MTSQLLDQRNVANAQTKNKAAGIRFGESVLTGNCGDGIARINIRNTSCDSNSARGTQKKPRMRERFAADTFWKPDRTIPEPFEFGGSFAHLACRAVIKLCRPDSDRSQLAARVHGVLLPSIIPYYGSADFTLAEAKDNKSHTGATSDRCLPQ